MSTNSPSLLHYNNIDNDNYSEDLFNSSDFVDSSPSLFDTTGPTINNNSNNNNYSSDLFSSASVPLTYSCDEDESQQQEQQQQQQPSVAGGVGFTAYNVNASSVLPLSQINNITDIETSTLRLKLAIELASTFVIKTNAGDNDDDFEFEDSENNNSMQIVFVDINNSGPPYISPEVALAGRKVITCVLELLNKVEGDSGKNEVILEAFSVLSDLYERFVGKEDLSKVPRRDDFVNQLGVDSIVTWIKDFMMRKVESALDGQTRGNFMQEVIDRLKPERMRQMILIGVIDVFRIVLSRMCAPVAAVRRGDEEIVETSDTDLSFRLLQILEQIIITTNNHPWMLAEDVWKLVHLERLCDLELRLFIMQIFVSRVATLARKKELITNVVMDISISDDEIEPMTQEDVIIID